MVVKEGYKQTEIGVIPIDWDVMSLYDLIKLKNGYGFSSEYFSNNGPIVITPGNFKLSGGLSFTEKNSLRFSGNYSIEMQFKNGDLLIVMTDLTPDCNLLGKPGIVNSEEIILHNQRIGKITIKNDVLDKSYLFWFFASELFSRRMKETATGSTVRHTSNGSIYNTQISIPTKAEQIAISNILTDTDGLITSLEKLIYKKRLIKQGATQQLLQPKEGWEEKKIIELSENKKELFDDGDWVESKHIINEGVRLIQTGNIGVGKYLEKGSKKYISENSFHELKCKPLIEGDILICRLADPAGRACIFPDINEQKVITSVDVTIFRPKSEFVNRNFLIYTFSTSKWFQQIIEKVGGTTHKRISRSSLGSIKITLPALEEQTRIATILSDMDAELSALEQKLDKFKKIKSGMMQELLTGKTRLV